MLGLRATCGAASAGAATAVLLYYILLWIGYV